MKNIDTLIPDVYQLVQTGKGAVGVPVASNRYDKHVADMVAEKVTRPAPERALHASKIGKNCLRQMWYAQWHQGYAEPLLPHTLIKFTYGDLVEELALDLVRCAGHEVRLEQSRVEFPTHNGFTVSGRIDAVIDGFIVDVKSTSPYSFNGWSGKALTADNDSFGYRWQLHTYARGLKDEAGVNMDRGYLLLLDKQNGHLGLSWVDFDMVAYDKRLEIITNMINDPKSAPPRNFGPEERDRLGNEKLPTECGYCDYKRECWKERDVKGVVRGGKVVWLVATHDGMKVKLKPGELELT
jgi:hypothetical protein